MNARTLADSALAAGREYKQHLWREHGVRDQPPLVNFHFRDYGSFDTKLADLDVGIQKMGLLPREIIENDGYFATISAFALQQIRNGRIADAGFDTYPSPDDRVEAIVAVCDGYIGSEDDDITGDSLEEDFKSNPDSSVVEGLMVFVYTDDLVGGCDVCILRQPYWIAEGGDVTWGAVAEGLPGDAAADTHPFTHFARDTFRAQGVI